MDRTPEPELMDDAAQARAYAAADFAEPNERFCNLLRTRLPPLPDRARVIDLGCGPADIACQLALEFPGWRITGADGSAAMLAEARRNVTEREVSDRVQLVLGRIPEVELGTDFDLILSNSLLHHLPDPAVLWTTIRQLAGSGTRVAVMDLARPASRAEAQHIVSLYSGDEPEILRRDFFNSLLAAFTVTEVRDQLRHQGLHQVAVEMVSDRHLFAWGSVGSNGEEAAP
jgi:trans-aconitate methyltransferase